MIETPDRRMLPTFEWGAFDYMLRQENFMKILKPFPLHMGVQDMNETLQTPNEKTFYYARTAAL